MQQGFAARVALLVRYHISEALTVPVLELEIGIVFNFFQIHKTCSIRTEGISKRFRGSRLISFIMFDNLTGSSFLRKLKLSSSVADLPKSMNCCMVSGEGLNWAKWSRVFNDFWSNNLLKFRVTAVSLIVVVFSLLTPPPFSLTAKKY